MANRNVRRAADRRISRSGGAGRAAAKGRSQPSQGRYTPPIPRSQKVSPPWVPALMFTLLGLGALVIVLNYVNLLPGPDPSNWYLLLGLGLITAGFATATQYH